MLLKYAALWPSHPFTFYVPYNHDADIETPTWAAARRIYADRLVAVKTASAMNETWRTLLDACCQADALVFWAPDDYYPLHLDAAGLDRVVNYVATQADLYGFSLAYTDGVWGNKASERIIEYPGAPLLYVDHTAQFGGAQDVPGTTGFRAGRILHHPRSNAFIWAPGFWRVAMFENLFLKSTEKRLRDLEIVVGDILDRNCNQSGNFYAQNRLERLKTPLVLFRETTHRGKVDVRVRDSMSAWNISVDGKFLPPLGPQNLPSYSRLGKLQAAKMARGGETAGTLPQLEVVYSLGLY